MRAYLHQDYDIVGDVYDNIAVFVRDLPDLAAQLPDEIAWTLSTFPAEPELEQFLDSRGCELRPLEGEGGYRGWLSLIAERVREELAGRD